MRLRDYPRDVLNRIKALRYDSILEKHEGPWQWEHHIPYRAEVLMTQGYPVLLPVSPRNLAFITVLKVIPSADGLALTLFLVDNTYYPEIEYPLMMNGYMAVCQRFPDIPIYVATVYHECFLLESHIDAGFDVTQLAKPKAWTVADYLALDRDGPTHYHYQDGFVELVDSYPNQDILLATTQTLIRQAAPIQEYHLLPYPVRVKANHDTYLYPNLAVVCGEPVELDADGTLLNPTILFEFEPFERGDWFSSRDYREIPSLQAYVYICTETVYAACHVREAVNRWSLPNFRQLTDTFTLEPLGVVLTLADLYEKITLPD